MYLKKNSFLYHIFVLVALITIWSCATPIAPTGGPRDQEGPKVLKTTPITGTTNFKTTKFEFQFNEFIKRTSIDGNITVEPDLGLEFSTKWKKKKLIVNFDEKLPDSSTIILTLGTDIADVKNNKMASPVTVAVSTGDEIDNGTLTGRIKNAETGKSSGSSKVLLYRSPINIEERANYQAETDTGGVFKFSYLKEGTYKALYVDDRNRNKIWDSVSEDAKPFNKEFILLGKDGADTLDVLYIKKPDTLAPKLQGIGMFSSNRLRLRFNENMTVQKNATIQVFDSLGNIYSSAYPLFISKKDPFVLFAQSEEAITDDNEFRIFMAGITDLEGNEVLEQELWFKGSTQQDTTLQRIISHKTASGLLPQQSVEVVYAVPITNSMLTDSIVVVEGDVEFTDWPEIRTENHVLFIDPQDSWIKGIDYKFLVWNPSTGRRQLLEPEIWDELDFGEISIKVEDPDTSNQYKLSLENKEISASIDTVFTGSLSLQNLAPVSYTLKVFRDINQNNSWDQGSIIPFSAPEPYYIQQNVNIRSGLTSEITIRF